MLQPTQLFPESLICLQRKTSLKQLYKVQSESSVTEYLQARPVCSYLNFGIKIWFYFSECLQRWAWWWWKWTSHQGEFPIGLYPKVKDSIKSLVTFLVLVRGIFFLYNLKAYVYSFILSLDSKFLGASFRVKNWF